MFNAEALSLAALFPTLARTATVNGASLNQRDFLGRGKVILDSTVGTGTTPALDVKLQDSADDSSFADIAGATFAQVTDAGASLQSIGIDCDAAREFIRAVATIAGTTPSFTFSVNMVGNQEAQG